MPLTVFDIKRIAATRREPIDAAVEAGGEHVSAPHEAWIPAGLSAGGVRVLITASNDR
jgi:hypothetical protein